MNEPSEQPLPGDAAALRPIIRLIRRISLLHEQGDVDEAARLEDQALAAAIRDFRAARGPNSLPATRLTSIYAEERRRAADALVLAEMLIPQLTAPAPARATPAAAPAAASPAPRPAPLPGGLAIPDLLDAMLDADRRRARPANP